VQLKGKALALVFALAAIAAGGSAQASIPRGELLETTAQIDLLHAPAIDLVHETTAQERVQSVFFFSRSSFAGLARIELPAPSIADQLARRLAAADAASRVELRVFEEAAKEKLASGVFANDAENNFKLFSQLGQKTHRGVEFQALPFVEHATGLIYVRARWYDPSSGTFVSPDPLGYVDSSNLYAFAGGDPVNRRDPTGMCGEPGEEQCGFWASAWKSAKETVSDQVQKGVDAAYFVADFVTDEGRQRNAQKTFDAGIAFAECGQNEECALASINGPQIDAERYLQASPEQRAEILGDIAGRWAVYGTEAYLLGKATGLKSRQRAAEIGPAPLPPPEPVPTASTPASTRIRTSVGNLRRAELRDAHHIIQDAAVRDLPGYQTELAPGTQLAGPSTARGSAHYSATQVQRQSGGGTYAAERRIAYKALRRAGFTDVEARAEIARADRYFESIGVTPQTKTRIPGNRR